MALPYVKVNVGEETLVSANSIIPFVPAILMKTKSGPIGTIEQITSEAQFVKLFGQSDETTPSAYAIQTYLRTYAYVLVTRLANESQAAEGSGKVSFEMSSKNHALISAKTNYKTDLFNLKEVKLVYDSNTNKIWLDVSSIVGKNAISIKEDIIVDSLKAAEYNESGTLTGGLEYILNRLVSSINAMNLGVTLTNEFTNKTTEDSIPSVEQFNQGFTLTISGGDCGNETDLSASQVNAYIDAYDSQDNTLDVMIIPEYTNYEVVNHASALAEKNNFVLLVAPGGESVSALTQKIANYNTTDRGSLALYYPNVKYSGFNAVIPASIAALHCYAKSDNQAKWSAPAGISRGTLNLVSSLEVNLTTYDMEALYDSDKPVNCINNISGRGFVIWGNKTTSAQSAFFDRLNVSRLVKYVTKEIYDISYSYLFEPITSTTFSSWVLKVEALLNDIQANSGLEAYQVTMDSTINTPATIAANQLNGIVKIKPYEVAEFITIDFTATDTITLSVEE